MPPNKPSGKGAANKSPRLSTAPLCGEGNMTLKKYNQLIPEFEVISSLKEIANLKRYFKSWGKISCKRNEISHGKSNPFLNLNISVKFSDLSDYLGEPIAKYEYELPNLKQEIETVINCYKKSFELLYLVKCICELEIDPNNRHVRKHHSGRTHL